MSVADKGRPVRGKSRISFVLTTVSVGVVTLYNFIGQEEGCSVGIAESSDGAEDGGVSGDGDGLSELTDGAEDGGTEFGVGGGTGEEVVNEVGSEVGLELGGRQNL
jgi:hypothetical protein